NGIAVLRYDKRTFTYTKEIDIEHFTPYEETVEDAVLAYEYLSNNSYVGSENIYIIGHSFGGYLMPKIAKLTPNAAGYILISAPVTPIEDLIVTQFEYIFNLDNVVSEEEQSLLTTYKIYQENIHNVNLESTLQHTELMGISKDYWLYLQSYTPQTEAKNINKPLLILNGERDYQVPITEFNNWKVSLENNDNVTFISYPGLNHLLYLGEGTPSPDEYYTPGHVSKDLLLDVVEWIYNN
ncbi:MAG: prolyl oligopeptidase family serine peptidase, partial [Clostridiales bacterium]|nr:prolyl oligopeptidase family serine peptidase [Clostridiales bacterium]